ncbi:ABC transporter substrate-binding protein [Nocardia nova]|uniref:ABC transporter substrate-binding protein n=1 Tax=Nocardia nova TaxID=37330 RepID=UPI0033EC403F
MADRERYIRKYLNALRAVAVPDERPRIMPTLLRRRKNRRLPPPIVRLIAPDTAEFDRPTGLLPRSGEWLAEPGGKRAVPRAVVDASEAPPDMFDPGFSIDGDRELEGHCLPILHELYLCFGSDDTAMGPIAFPRYRTADWLTRQRLTGSATEASEQLRERLPNLLRRAPAADRSASALGAVGGTLARVLTIVLSLWPVVRLWLFVSSHIPGLSRVSYWFMHQRYLTPRLSHSFIGFGVRLTEPMRRRESSDQIAKLLVNAFLEDLRAAYRRTLWRPSGWRRTAFPVALFDQVRPDDSASRLMRLVNEIRNETGLFDPLVIVARIDGSAESPSARFADLGVTVDGEVRDPLKLWRADIDERRRHRGTDSWYLTLPLPDSLSGELPRFGRSELAYPPAPPWAARRSVVAAVALLPVVALVAVAVVVVQPRLAAGCTPWPWRSGVDVAVRGTECVGLSGSAAQVFSDDPELGEMQREVFHQNAVAERRRHDNPRRPLVTLVYFAGMTYIDRNGRYPHAQAEELAGLAVRQRWANRQSGASEPLLRVVIANGGTTMRYATWVVDHQISRLVRSDPTVIGVVGLDRSSDETRRAIARLGELGMPTMATTLSADGLGQVSPTYFQPVLDNSMQAKLVADYVSGARNPDGSTRYGKVYIYVPDDPADIYVRTLETDLRQALGPARVGKVDPWTDQGQIPSRPIPCAPADPGQPADLLFFGGRNPDFGPFVNAVAQHCGAAMPPILANDTATRAVSDKLVQDAAPVGFPVHYVAKGVPALLAGSGCVRDGTPDRSANASPSMFTLCNELTELRHRLPHFQVSWPGDRTGIGFDVAELFLGAVKRNRSRPEYSGAAVNRAAIGLELRRKDLDADTVTGDLSFAGEDGQVKGASIAILMTPDLNNADVPPKCLLQLPLPGDGTDGCPPGTDSDTETWVRPPG